MCISVYSPCDFMCGKTSVQEIVDQFCDFKQYIDKIEEELKALSKTNKQAKKKRTCLPTQVT